MRISLALILLFVGLYWTPSAHAQLSTEDHLAGPGFWPTQKISSRVEYSGPGACASCHSAIAAAQATTPMRNAALHAGESGILRDHPKLKFSVTQYKYELNTDGRQTRYTLTDGERTLDAVLLWAFGIGRVAQSYLFKKDDGSFYEARVTFFAPSNNLEFTPGRALPSPKSAEEAMYRRVGAAEVARCFGCHTSGSMAGNELDEKYLTPGLTCEACHGPGAKHVAAMQAAKALGLVDTAGTIFNSATLKPADSVDFCGACHGTWWDVKLSGVRGPSSARSQPYRLELSKCWGKGDARLTCIACHDPHQPLETDAAAYDAACLQCHLSSPSVKKTADHPGAACPVNTKNCVSCHMPKVYVPDMHANFTDHEIRIARAGETYPE